MRDSSDNRDFDKLFQSRLRNDSPAENKWNVPPINVFENAIASLEEEQPEKKKRYLWPFVFISLIVAGIVFVLVRNTIMLDKLDDKIEILSNLQSENIILNKPDKKIEEANFLQSQSQLNQGKSSQAEPSEIQQSQGALSQTKNTTIQPVVQTDELKTSDNVKLEGIKKEKLNTENKIDQTSLNELERESKSDDGFLNSTLLYKERSELNNFNKINADNVSVANADPIIDKNNEQLVSLLEVNPLINVRDGSKNDFKSPTSNILLPLQTKAIDLMTDDENILSLNFIDEDLNPVPKNTSNPFSAYLFAGSNFSSFTMNDSGMENATLTKYDKKYLGYQIGVGLDHKLASKWFLNYSLQYKIILNKSIYQDQIYYLKSDEHLDSNGSMIYSCERHVATPTGMHTDVMKMEVEENKMKDGDMLDSNTETKQVFPIASTSLSINYVPFRLAKFDVVLSGGLAANQIFSGKQNMNTQIYFEDKLMMRDSHATNSTFEGKRFYLSGFGGIGIKYNLSQCLSISLDNNFERSFTSIGKRPNGSGSYLKINSIYSNLKIGFQF